jgi:hypothetical protein
MNLKSKEITLKKQNILKPTKSRNHLATKTAQFNNVDLL